ncbi:Down syndrome critical region protein 3 [Heterocephalus glaber]|uniref:Vacuolar protein sorting-associated protein 26C n=1 Tax=Heterocephalus glaber TaxID=10181 RepID=G5AXI0_HETGA|nr:Down syndrome critical region protein 3 [Heterocephalus glaber]
MGTSLDIKIKRANKVYHAGFLSQFRLLLRKQTGLSAGSQVQDLLEVTKPLLFSQSSRTPSLISLHSRFLCTVFVAVLKAAQALFGVLAPVENLACPRCWEMLSGVVVLSSRDSVQHQGVSLTMEGTVNLQLSAKSVGVFEAFYNSVKPIQIINSTIEMVKPGKFPSGKTEIPFEFPLHVKGNKVLYETYHGVFVNIQYTLRCDMRRSLLAKDLTKTCEFIVHSAPQKGKLTPSPVDFTITPETLQNVKERALLPKFLIRGHLSSTNCVITQPLTGELVVEHSDAAIRSIELQLVRVETCGCAEGYARDATEIQNIQIADGDVCRGLSVPIHMVFPRLFTCPTLETTNFKVEFEANVVVLLHADHLITENFPLRLCRT